MVLQEPLVDLMALTAPEVYREFFTANTMEWTLLYVKLQSLSTVNSGMTSTQKVSKPTPITHILELLRGIYGKLCTSKGPVHKYLQMDLGYSESGKVKFSMKKYSRNVPAESPEDLRKTAKSPPME